MVKTILSALSRGAYGYPTLESAFPTLQDLADYLLLKRVVFKLGDTAKIELPEPQIITYQNGNTRTKEHQSIWIPSPLDIAHGRISFGQGGSLASDNIFLLEQGANRGFRYENPQPSTFKHKPLTNTAELFRQGEHLYGKDWFDKLKEMLAGGSTFNDIRKVGKKWREVIATVLPEAMVKIEKTNSSGRTSKQYLLSVNDIKRELGMPVQSPDWWLMIGLGLANKTDFSDYNFTLDKTTKTELLRAVHQEKLNPLTRKQWAEKLELPKNSRDIRKFGTIEEMNTFYEDMNPFTMNA